MPAAFICWIIGKLFDPNRILVPSLKSTNRSARFIKITWFISWSKKLNFVTAMAPAASAADQSRGRKNDMARL